MRRKPGASVGRHRANDDTSQSAGSQLFDMLSEAFCTTDTRVERVKLFGYDCLRSAGKVFAKTHNGRLVMKLPADRIGRLIGTGVMEPYERGRGGMKEWAVMKANDKKLVIALADEARAFVDG